MKQTSPIYLAQIYNTALKQIRQVPNSVNIPGFENSIPYLLTKPDVFKTTFR
jgi:hypothetical protein